MRIRFFLLAILLLAPAAFAARSTVETPVLESTFLRDNRVGLSTRRPIKVYLPPGYAQGTQRYPVIYMLHGLNWSNDRMFGEGTAAQPTFDKAIASGLIKPFIAVAPDYTAQGPGTFFVNSATAGRFEDYTVREVVPFIDSHYRTLPSAGSRAIMGEHLGAFGALWYAFRNPDVWSVVYALHPVGAGPGLVPMWSRPDWQRVKRAKNFAELAGDPYTPVFVAMSQAFLPNADRPPFYCDFIVNLDAEPVTLNVANSRLLQSRFFLEHAAVDNLDKVRKLRGIKFDWGRYDPNPDHVYSNQAFTRRLEELGIEHEAEEYRGLPWDKYWIDDGRVINEVLPFFAKRLDFQ